MGAKKNLSNLSLQQKAFYQSCISKSSLFELFYNTLNIFQWKSSCFSGFSLQHITYWEAKRKASSKHEEGREKSLTSKPFQDWIQSNPLVDNFYLH